MVSGELFLSHAAADRDLAEYLELTARRCISGIDVFRTTRTGQIPGGREWLGVIRNHLLSADRFLILLTPASIRRPWIWFEAGAIWVRGLPFVPALAGGLTPSDLPEPLKSLQLLSLESPTEAAQALLELGGTLDDPGEFVARVRQLAELGRAEALKDEGWQGFEHETQFYAWDGPFDQLARTYPVPIPDRLLDRIKQLGLEARTGIEGDLMNEYSKGYAQLFRIDDSKRMRPLVSKDAQVLLVRLHTSS